MSAKVAIKSDGAPAPSAYLSSAILSGDFLFLSGSCGADPKTGAFIEGTVKDRTKQAMKNVQALLKEVGLDLEDIVATTIYLSKYKEDFLDMNEAYVEVFNGHGPMPSRTCIGVAALPKDTDVEITCTAARRPKTLL